MFEKHEIEKLTKLADSIKAKDDVDGSNEKYWEFVLLVNKMRDLSNEATDLRIKYIAAQYKFNKLRNELFNSGNEEVRKKLSQFISEKQGFDKKVFGR